MFGIEVYQRTIARATLVFLQQAGVYHVPLLEICRRRGLNVLADVHTHPGRGTGQSQMDRDNPMFSVKGYTELIVPNFGYCSRLSFAGVGVYRYDGNGKWFTYLHSNDALEFTLI